MKAATYPSSLKLPLKVLQDLCRKDHTVFLLYTKETASTIGYVECGWGMSSHRYKVACLQNNRPYHC